MSNDMKNGQRYLAFSLGAEHYAIPLLSVREVIGVPPITPLPFMPGHFLGIMNLRGNVISVIDLRRKIGLKAEAGAENSIIICGVGSTQLGCLVDSVNAVLCPPPDAISDPPEMQGGRNANFISAVFRHEDKLVLMIDVESALTSEDRKAISQQQSQPKAKAA